MLKVLVTSNDHIRGNENAFVTLVEYGDYECPDCSLAHEITKQIILQFPQQFRFVYRHFPLKEAHSHAEMAAEVAEFAGSFGLFWEMHDLLFENQYHLDYSLFLKFGKILDLPIHDLEEVLKKKTFLPKIHNDFQGGIKSGVNGTPTFYINDHLYEGPILLDDFLLALEAPSV